MEKQMDTPTFNPSDIVKFAAAKDAVNISTAFDQLVGQRVYDAIEARKQELAKQMFNQGEQQDAEQEEQDDAGETVDDNEDSTAEHEEQVGDEEQSTETEESDEAAEQNT
jgi:hypothetical protein